MNSKKKLHFTKLVGLLLLSLTWVAQVQASSSHASGGGTYFVKPGILSEFQLSESHVQCKIGYGVLDDGTVLQMWMFSTNIDSVSVNSAAQTVDITGTMISIVTLHFTDGTSAHRSRAPACQFSMAAGVTKHVWTIKDLLLNASSF